MEEKKVLTKMSFDELSEFILSLDERKFCVNQIISWIYVKAAASFEQMTDIKKELREKLIGCAKITDVKIKTKQMSADGTIKYLLEYSDGALAECVLMRFDNRGNLSACVSSQVGCPMGCAFCATAKRGFIRNLLPYEMVEQILTIERDTGLKVTNVVFMGQGEPFNNFDNVYKAIQIINSKLMIGIRRITVSTCGIAPKIREIAKKELIPTLAISLHAPNNALRAEIMPVEKKYNLQELKNALKYYIDETKKRVTLEYILIDGLTDTKDMALELISYMKYLKCNVNLIPYNPITPKDKFKKPSKKNVMFFKYLLESSGKKVTVRLERGADIDAACGQLAAKTDI
ncbi:MAG: 23S rRNA (adenine(2503)-C(2))-methyltransferase RlmN [Candidatus Gastranaerophilales bacterium]|nr:23S rRNA (adenine(2503)-C(2))-methyltransferase RlmN [Candidatus Gastranaerophilales bacterium]